MVEELILKIRYPYSKKIWDMLMSISLPGID